MALTNVSASIRFALQNGRGVAFFDSAEKLRRLEGRFAKTPVKMVRHQNKSILGQSLTYKILRIQKGSPIRADVNR